MTPLSRLKKVYYSHNPVTDIRMIAKSRKSFLKKNSVNLLIHILPPFFKTIFECVNHPELNELRDLIQSVQEHKESSTALHREKKHALSSVAS